MTFGRFESEAVEMASDQVIECLDDRGDATCEGSVEYRFPLSGTGKSFARCDKHWSIRLDLDQQLRERYPEQAPADFDPSYAGERWSEDDY